MKYIEMIIDYITDGTDYQYNDNHGILTRCCDCLYYDTSKDVPQCCMEGSLMYPDPNEYCSRAVRK